MRGYVLTIIVSCSFFFQAEDGIRDDLVTGVQTCALPISLNDMRDQEDHQLGLVDIRGGGTEKMSDDRDISQQRHLVRVERARVTHQASEEIGRASCRERV